MWAEQRMNESIRFISVSKSYQAVAALKSLSFTASEGQVLAVLGRNGAGKTTLINLLVGLIDADTGGVTVLGDKPPFSAATRQKIAFAPQRLALYHNLTVAENLALFGAMQGLAGHTLRERIAQVSAQLELERFLSQRVQHCSEGIKRRTHLAVALLVDAAVYLFDEPTAGVDVQSRQRILQVVSELRANHKTVLYTTHYIEEIEKLADVVLVIDQGNLLAFGSLAEIAGQYSQGSRISYQHEPNAPVEVLHSQQPAEDLRQLIAQHTNLVNLSVLPPRLEDIVANIIQRSLAHE